MWQCDTLGLPVCYMGVLLPYLELRSYVIRPAPGEVEFIREECLAFLESLAKDEPPDVDAGNATWRTLRKLHPDIAGDIDVPAELAVDYAQAVVDLRDAETEHVLQRNKLAAHMGSARRALVNDWSLAVRRASSTGVPYVKAGTDRALFTILEELTRG